MAIGFYGTLKKRGGSLVVTIPSTALKALDLKENDMIGIDIIDTIKKEVVKNES